MSRRDKLILTFSKERLLTFHQKEFYFRISAVDKIFLFFFLFFSNLSRYYFFRIPFREIDGRCSNVRTANISCRGKYLNVDSTRYIRELCVPPIVSNYTPIHIRVHYNHPLADGSKYLRIISREYISC